jgi:hypothetical protein
MTMSGRLAVSAAGAADLKNLAGLRGLAVEIADFKNSADSRCPPRKPPTQESRRLTAPAAEFADLKNSADSLRRRDRRLFL